MHQRVKIMKHSEKNSAYPLVNFLSYIFLFCGIVLISLEVVSYFRAEEYSLVEASDKYFIAMMMFLWYWGLRHLKKKYIRKGES
ncbi:hypothetical protein A33Q_1598 [Indibacter alkaliphilus LW1]|uniref:Uncharacterized protein n=2 Tax=Indibacter TaxID=647744 RepID=S2DFS3_INDAL|nr:hypothetical protein A33Q_1598 [Indibacter alkaliphilus LW1]